MSELGGLLTIGEALVSMRSAGPLAFGSPLVPHLAGAESNVAIGLARLGHRVSWVGRVGADAYGTQVVRALRGEGVDVSHVVTDPEAPTALLFLEQRTADVTGVEYRRAGSAGSRLRPADLDGVGIGDYAMVHLSGITPALSASAAATVLEVLAAASESGVAVSLDVNYRAKLWSRSDAAGALRPMLSQVSVVIAGEDELGLLADGGEAAAVAHLLDRGVSQIAVKRGAAGASLFTADGRDDAAGHPVTAVDTVGAGDAFCAGLLSARLDGCSGPQQLARANALGAWAVSTVGDWHGLPSRTELESLAPDRAADTVR